MQPPGRNGGVAVEDLGDAADPVVDEVIGERRQERASAAARSPYTL